jgi:hypothetical protein
MSSSGGGATPATPSESRNYVFTDDAQAALLTGLKSGDTVRIAASGVAPNTQVKWWQVLVPGTGTMATATLVELATKEAADDSAVVQTVADEVARLALSDKYNPFRVIRQTDTDETWLQVANPASAPASWTSISGIPVYGLIDGGDRLVEGADSLVEH